MANSILRGPLPHPSVYPLEIQSFESIPVPSGYCCLIQRIGFTLASVSKEVLYLQFIRSQALRRSNVNTVMGTIKTIWQLWMSIVLYSSKPRISAVGGDRQLNPRQRH